MARLEVKRSYTVLQFDDWIAHLCPLREPTVVSNVYCRVVFLPADLYGEMMIFIICI